MAIRGQSIDFKKEKRPLQVFCVVMHSCLQYWFILPNSQVLWNIIKMKMFELKKISPCNTFMECQGTIICSEIYLSLLLETVSLLDYWLLYRDVQNELKPLAAFNEISYFSFIHSAFNNTSRPCLLSQGLATDSCWRRTGHKPAQDLECCCKWS